VQPIPLTEDMYTVSDTDNRLLLACGKERNRGLKYCTTATGLTFTQWSTAGYRMKKPLKTLYRYHFSYPQHQGMVSALVNKGVNTMNESIYLK
jgi:hypothetical protein